MFDFLLCSVSNSTLSSFFSALSTNNETQIDSAVKEIMRELFQGAVGKRHLLYSEHFDPNSPLTFEKTEACIPDKTVIELIRAYINEDTEQFKRISTEIAEEFDINDYQDIAEQIYSVIFW